MGRPKGSRNKPKPKPSPEPKSSPEPEPGLESALVIELKPKQKSEPVEISWDVHCKICRAIVLIHHCARYFEGMQILCELIGWNKNSLLNEFDSIAERKKTRESFNYWVRELAKNL